MEQDSGKAFDEFLQGGADAALRSSTAASTHYNIPEFKGGPNRDTNVSDSMPSITLSSSPRLVPRKPSRIGMRTAGPHTGSHPNHRLVRDLYEWLCRRPRQSRHVGTTLSEDGGATFADFYAEFPHHAAKRKCKGSGIKNVIEAHGSPLLEWVDSGNCGMGRVRVKVHPEDTPYHPALVNNQHAMNLLPSARHHAPPLPAVSFSNAEEQMRLGLTRLDLSSSFSSRALTPSPTPPSYIQNQTNSLPPHFDKPQSVDLHKSLSASLGSRRGISDLMQRDEIKGSSVSMQPQAKNFARLCKFAASATTCPYGDNCRYAHTISEVESTRLAQRHHLSDDNPQQHSAQEELYRRSFSTTSLPILRTSSLTNQPHSEFGGRAYSRRLELEVTKVVQEAGIETFWIAHLVGHELDRQALSLCEDHDFDMLGLPLGARIKLRNWAERERASVVTPATESLTSTSLDWDIFPGPAGPGQQQNISHF